MVSIPRGETRPDSSFQHYPLTTANEFEQTLTTKVVVQNEEDWSVSAHGCVSGRKEVTRHIQGPDGAEMDAIMGTFVKSMVSSSSVIQDDAKEAVKDWYVASSNFEMTLLGTSCGLDSWGR